MGIEGWVGRPGAGKTYTLTERVMREANRGRMCFTNYGVRHDNVYLFQPDQLLDLPPGLIVIDEAHLWFPARKSLQLPASWLAMLSQTRKNGWDLIWTAQHETRVDRVLRDVSTWIWLTESWFRVGGHPLLFRSRQWEPEAFRQPGKHYASRVRFFDQRVANAYDTLERLTIADHAADSKDAYATRSARGRQYLRRDLADTP